jgi:predicted PurR-regulated permease PerM
MYDVKEARYYARVFALVTAAVLGVLLFRQLTPFASPIMWAFLIAFMLHPLKKKLLQKRPQKPGLVAGLLTSGVFVFIAGPVAVFVFVFVKQATDLLVEFQDEARGRKLPALQLILELGPIKTVLARLGEFTSLTKDQILTSASEIAQGAIQQGVALSSSVVLGTFSAISQFALTVFLLFFFLRDGQEMLRLGIRLIPMEQERKTKLFETLGGVAQAVVLGTLVTAVAQGTLLGIGFAIAGLPSPLVFGALGAVASLIPVVGTFLVWGPAAISLVAQGRSGWALFLVLWGAVLVGGSDNFIRPLIISGRSQASTLLVFVGLLGGLSVFGFAGIFMGPLLLTLVASLLAYADQAMRHEPPV